MEDPFIITVTYKGQDRDFEAELLQMGYTHKFHVIIEEVDLYFERDEERNYRAILGEDTPTRRLPDMELIKLIAEKIEAILA